MKTTISSEDSLQLTLQTRSPRSRFGRHVVGCLAATACLAATVSTAAAGDFAAPLVPPAPPAEDEWVFGFDAYGWMASINGVAATGEPIDIGFDDLLENLDMTFMGGFSARKGKWQVGSDFIWLDVGAKPHTPLVLGATLDSVKMKSWVINPTVSYTVADGNWGQFDVLAGARYLYLKTRLTTSRPGIAGRVSRSVSASGDAWDGVVGVRGHINLSERWFMPYHIDMGAGDSDMTWQAFLGFGYHFEKLDLIVGYRHMDWDLGNGRALKNMDLGGPIIGAKFEF